MSSQPVPHHPQTWAGPLHYLLHPPSFMPQPPTFPCPFLLHPYPQFYPHPFPHPFLHPFPLFPSSSHSTLSHCPPPPRVPLLPSARPLLEDVSLPFMPVVFPLSKPDGGSLHPTPTTGSSHKDQENSKKIGIRNIQLEASIGTMGFATEPATTSLPLDSGRNDGDDDDNDDDDDDDGSSDFEKDPGNSRERLGIQNEEESESEDQRAKDETETSNGVRTKKSKILKVLLNLQRTSGDFHAQKAASCESARDLSCLKALANYPPAKKRQRPAPGVKKQKIPANGTTNFICPVEGCGKRFRRKEHVLRHEMCHSGMKPFHCATCNVAFSRSDVLSLHEKTQKHMELILLRGLENKDISWQDVVTILD